MKRFTFVFLLLTTIQSFAAEVVKTLIVPSGSVVAGSRLSVDLVALNPSARDVPFATDAECAGTLAVGNNSWSFKAVGSSDVSRFVPPGGYAARRYTFDLPAEAAGRASLELKGSDGLVVSAQFTIAAASENKSSGPEKPTQLEQVISAAPATSALARGFAGRFMPNQPVYFIYGDADQGAKFQFSFDYRLATIVSGAADNHNITTLRLGYTQRTLWDIDGPSSPFYDTSYMPEFTINVDAPMPKDPNQRFTWLGWRAGLQHESNGKDGPDSRSLNTVYFRPRFVVGKVQGWALIFLPEVFAYVTGLGDNSDLKDYRGYGKLKFYIERNNGLSLLVSAWSGQHFNHGSYQLDFTYPVSVRWLNIQSYLYLQYFNGYGESLLAYRRKSDSLRFGVGLLR